MIPLRLTGKHEGLIVWHTPEELERLWRGVAKDVVKDAGRGPLEHEK